MWRHAHNTSIKRGLDCYFFSGCRHAAEVAAPGTIHETEEQFATVEKAWAERAQKLFAEKTAHWTEAQRSSWQKFLGDGTFLPGAVAELPFSPATPAQPEQ